MKRQHAYHHGDLRRACIDAGLALLVEEGRDAVSLRAIARRCAVSPRAPYQHFADKTELLAAVAEVGFAKFGAALTTALESARPAKLRLAVLAQAYIDFALAHPELMQLMFGDDFVDRSRRFPGLDAAALATFDLLEREVAALGTSGRTRERAAIAWAMVHGLAELSRKGQFTHVLPSARERERLGAAASQIFCGGVV